MARSSRKLTVHYTAASQRDLDDIWDWNAKTRGERQAESYVNFLLDETRKLAQVVTPGRVIPSAPTLSYHTIKRRAGGHGHVVVFGIEGDTLHVFHYFHTAQDWERKLEGMPDSESEDAEP